ncbi:MAG: putative sensor domain DACNV-containing protein [Actinomycetota bacterium]
MSEPSAQTDPSAPELLPGGAHRRHAYPGDLARFVRERWEKVPASGGGAEHEGRLPDPPVLEALLSTCYQASLLREEERPVVFRLIFAGPELLPERGGPPGGLHRLEFAEPRPFDQRELRRLSPAADFERSLIGVRPGADGGLEIWGLVHSGPRWLRRVQGGREPSAPMPPVPVVEVQGPGNLQVLKGSASVAELEAGRLAAHDTDVFASRWLPDLFAAVRAELVVLHESGRREAAASGEPWAPLDPDLSRKVSQQMVKRLVSTVRGARHGGTIVIVPPHRAEGILSGDHIALKHAFADGEPRRRFRTLIVAIMNRLAQAHGRGEEASYPRAVGWREYVESEDRRLAELDEAIFEFAHLVAGLAAVDGAVVMTQRYELLGFGGEISGDLPAVSSVRKSLDLEGEMTVPEGTEEVGTRHRSAYRLVGAMPGALVVVVSQDGDARFVRNVNGSVVCWDQA